MKNFLLALKDKITHPLVGSDVKRIAVTVAIMALAFLLSRWLPGVTNEAALSPLLVSIAVGLAFAYASHPARRILFPYIDLKKYAERALEQPVSASIVFLGVCLVLCVLIWSGGAMMR